MAMVVVSSLPGPATAQEEAPPARTEDFQLYRVEIVIFEQLQAPRHPEDPGRPPLPPEPVEEPTNIPGIVVEQAQPLPQSGLAEAGTPIEQMEPEPLFFEPVDLQDLADVARTLDRRADYRVLLREAWRQPGFPKEQSRPVDLETLARLRDLITDTAGNALSSSRVPTSDPPPVPSGDMPPPETEPLDASATLWLGRYLHLTIDADLTTESGVGHLHESRRMRSGEVHYFDSPRLGAIATVVPEDVTDSATDTPDPGEVRPTPAGAGLP